MLASRQGPDLADVAAELREVARTRDVADVLGVKLRKSGANRYVGLCPLHGERSPSFTIGGGSGGPDSWFCFGCQAGGGDALSLLMAVQGLAFTDAVGELASSYGIVIPDTYKAPGGRRPGRPRPSLAKPPKRPPVAPGELVRSLEEAAAHRATAARFWRWCEPLLGDDEAYAYLVAARGFSSEDLADIQAEGLARVVPSYWTLEGAWPWANALGRHWSNGWRLVVPRYDARGRLASVQGRWCRMGADGPIQAPEGRKSTSPHQGRGGPPGRGTVMACTMGRLVLERGQELAPLTVKVAEGETDWLALASGAGYSKLLRGNAGHSPPPCEAAVLGVLSGAWSAELAARIPTGSTVELLTDPDGAGTRYADAVRQTLAHRCTFKVLPRTDP